VSVLANFAHAASPSSPSPSPSGSPSLTDWGDQLQQQVQQAQGAANTLQSACGTEPGFLCRITFALTGKGSTARFVGEFLDAPIRLLLSILFIIALAWFIRRLSHRLILRMVTRAGQSGVPERLRIRGKRGKKAREASLALMGERRRQRAETTGSVLRSIATVVIFGIAAMMVLEKLGMDLGPVLASAGIAGVAVGFGAQNLVKDYMSGIFMLLEDQYGVGDTIDVGEAVGVVEVVTLRTTRLRDADGVVWYVRNGEVVRVGNKSQGWSRAIVDFPVEYDSDVERIIATLRETAAAFAEDEDWRDKLTGEPDVWGVQAMSGSAIVIRIVVKTTAGDQGMVQRELRRRAKSALDAQDVKLAHIGLSAADVM